MGYRISYAGAGTSRRTRRGGAWWLLALPLLALALRLYFPHAAQAVRALMLPREEVQSALAQCIAAFAEIS